MDKWNFEKKGLDFLANAPSEKVVTRGVYKVLIADDDEQMHTITKVMLEKFVFEGHRIEFIDAYTGEDTMRICAENPDIAVLFLDVVMEDVNTGLHVVQYIRNELKNKRVRIILRTGQPGEAPEEEVIRDYDINDYRLKTELSVKRLYTSLFSALRNYRDIMSLEKHQEGLKKIIQASAHMFEHNSLDEFLVSILEELANFQKNENFDMMYLTEMQCDLQSGFVTILENNRHKIVAGTGKYKAFVGNQVEEIIDLQEIYAFLSKGDRGDSIIHKLKSGILIESKSQGIMSNFIFVEGHDEIFDLELINVFLVNFSIALNNYILNHIMNTTQKEIVYALTETVESHFGETGSHVKRISEMMYRFAIRLRYSYPEAEMIKIASTMHDLGKIAIPDAILKKPGKLTPEEFEVIKQHPTSGYKILNKSELPALRLAAEIALYHHEKYDGTGYPAQKSNLDIPKSARMMAIIDVFDAMSHKRIYKEAASMEETLAFINSQKGKHFDPDLVDLFMSNLDYITENMK